MLARVAQVIKEHLSAADIAARYGGEEFAVLLFEKSFEEAYALIEQVRQELSHTSHEEMEQRAVTVSIGLKSYDEGTTKETLFEEVDNLLYTAKHSGKNTTLTPMTQRNAV